MFRKDTILEDVRLLIERQVNSATRIHGRILVCDRCTFGVNDRRSVVFIPATTLELTFGNSSQGSGLSTERLGFLSLPCAHCSDSSRSVSRASQSCHRQQQRGSSQTCLASVQLDNLQGQQAVQSCKVHVLKKNMDSITDSGQILMIGGQSPFLFGQRSLASNRSAKRCIYVSRTIAMRDRHISSTTQYRVMNESDRCVKTKCTKWRRNQVNGLDSEQLRSCGVACQPCRSSTATVNLQRPPIALNRTVCFFISFCVTTKLMELSMLAQSCHDQ